MTPSHEELANCLEDEEEHVDGIETPQSQIEQMSLEIFLTTKTGR